MDDGMVGWQPLETGSHDDPQEDHQSGDEHALVLNNFVISGCNC